MGKPMQKIFFGPPGCGKSFRVREDAKKLGLTKNSPNIIESTFHPEYGYGDFVAKLLPQTVNGDVKYNIHAGPLIKALARAYAEPDQPVLLVIDEINRGNCAQIFGDIFQLLDRKDDGWSEYGIDMSDLVMDALKRELGNLGKQLENLSPELKVEDANNKVTGYKLRLPPKLSLISTMNTSDESVYYMDTAFKRRWDFEYMKWQGKAEIPGKPDTPELIAQETAKIENILFDNEPIKWHVFLIKLNDFIAHKFKGRCVDDKQVGIWFLKASSLPRFKESVEQRVMLTAEQVELLKKLRSLYEKTKWREWKKIIPKSEKVTEWGDEETPDAGQLKSILNAHYKIDGNALDLGGNAEYFAKHITDYIFDKCPSTQHNVKLTDWEIGDDSKPEIELDAIKNKLMFFLWDNVFSRSRDPLYELLEKGEATEKKPRTFGDFSAEVDAFIKGVMKWDHVEHKLQE